MLVCAKYVIKGTVSNTEDPERQFCDDVIPLLYILSDASTAGIHATCLPFSVHQNQLRNV